MNKSRTSLPLSLLVWLVLALAPAAYAVLAGEGAAEALASLGGWLGLGR